jgi:hypothetical protein
MDQVRRVKDLERENARLRLSVSDLTLDKLILPETAGGGTKTRASTNYWALPSAGAASITSEE